LAFFRQLLEDDEIRRAELHTGLVDEFLSRRPKPERDAEIEAVAALVAQAFLTAGSPSTKNHTGRNASAAWRLAGRDELLQ
jgi:hypothetical protein